MLKNIQSVRGMNDYFFLDTLLLEEIEHILKKILFLYSFNEVKLPIIEYYDLFKCAIGSITDIIEKEIYAFNDRSNCKIALRPEGTVGCARLIIEHGLFFKSPHRLWYSGPMFRYERPQRGRYRQFYQFGMEIIGIIGPEADAELILICNKLWNSLNLNHKLFLEINTIGSIYSRLAYFKDLKIFLQKNKSFFNNSLWIKVNKNPLVLFDMKDSHIIELLSDAPLLNDYIDDNSHSHFKELCSILDSFHIKYIINPKLVRGLDYYNNTVFEWITNDLGSQNAVCAGGRYDHLFKKISKYDLPGVGCAIGMDRLLLLYKNVNFVCNKLNFNFVYIIGDYDVRIFCMHLADKLRNYFSNVKFLINIINKFKNFSKYYIYAKKNNVDIILFINKSYLDQNLFFMYDFRYMVKKMISYDDFLKYFKKFISDSIHDK